MLVSKTTKIFSKVYTHTHKLLFFVFLLWIFSLYFLARFCIFSFLRCFIANFILFWFWTVNTLVANGEQCLCVCVCVCVNLYIVVCFLFSYVCAHFLSILHFTNIKLCLAHNSQFAIEIHKLCMTNAKQQTYIWQGLGFKKSQCVCCVLKS